MRAPKILVVTRFVRSDGWKDGFPVNCVKYGSDKYSCMFEYDKTFKEEKIFEGECPLNLRILPLVEPRYLRHYMTFYSQTIPHGIDLRVADAVRNECNGMFDGEAYHPTGKIISLNLYQDHSAELKNFLTSFMKQEDWDRIDRFDKLGLENWNEELYEKETV